jgi:hypothetical protein
MSILPTGIALRLSVVQIMPAQCSPLFSDIQQTTLSQRHGIDDRACNAPVPIKAEDVTQQQEERESPLVLVCLIVIPFVSCLDHCIHCQWIPRVHSKITLLSSCMKVLSRKAARMMLDSGGQYSPE